MERLQKAITERTARIGILGLGQVGLFQAIEMARLGYHVLGIDVDHRRVEAVRGGDSYITDIPSTDLQQLSRAGRLQAATEARGLDDCDIIVLSVPTPAANGQLVMSAFESAAETVAAHARPGQLFVVRSTVFPGASETYLLPRLTARGLIAGNEIALAAAPERCNVGNRVYLDATIPRVVGGVTPTCTTVAGLFYEQFGAPIVPVGIRVAELSKLLENVFRFVNISLANELAAICDRLEIEPRDVVQAAATKPFGFMPFTPGAGIGGIPMVSVSHHWVVGAEQLGVSCPVVQGAMAMDQRAPDRIVDQVAEAIRSANLTLETSRILLIGITYKPNVGDDRDSAALRVMERLHTRGAVVQYHDPYVDQVRVGGVAFHSVPLTKDILCSTDCVALLVNHRSLDLEQIKQFAPRLIDTCNAIRT